MRLWVDTDFGFDDLWALLLLRHLDISVDGVSLVAGNVPLQQAIKNAFASIQAFGFNWPIHAGAAKPLKRKPETAVRILGKFGMQSRGQFLPYADLTADARALETTCRLNHSAVDAMRFWLNEQSGSNHILALGPLTNLAQLISHHPESAQKIEQITWLGGSRGRGNHSEFAEYNALADPDALALISASDLPFRMIDLELCRQVTFGESDMPGMRGGNKQLIADLLGGYLDIALQRGRDSMSVYDPLAALSVADESLFSFRPATLTVHTTQDAHYGQTVIDTTRGAVGSEVGGYKRGNFEIAMKADADRVLSFCLTALTEV